MKNPIVLPNIYEGKLNTSRIKEYKELTTLYNIDKGTIAQIFNRGADWYKKIIENNS